MNRNPRWTTYYREQRVTSENRINQVIESESALLNEVRATLPGLTKLKPVNYHSKLPRMICSLCGFVPKRTALLTLVDGSWRCLSVKSCTKRQKEPHWIP